MFQKFDDFCWAKTSSPTPSTRGEGAKSPSPLERDFPKGIPLERVRSKAENKKINMTK